MIYDWGHVNQKDNETLDKEFKLLQKQVSKTRDKRQVEKHVSTFLAKYTKIGEDPTDTIIRDRVWDRLRKLTRTIITEQELNNVWEKEVYTSSAYCTIQ
jgi:hypothetical protein